VVHIAQPAGGAPVAYRRCFDGASYGADGILMRHLMGSTPNDVFTVFTAMPGALQLLPFDQARRTDAGDWLRKSGPADKGAFVGWTKMAAAIQGYKATSHPPSLAPEINRPSLRRGATDEERANWEATRRDADTLLTAAHAFHDHLELRKHPNTWSLASTSVDTDEHVCFEIGPLGLKGGVTFNLAAGRTNRGDGTVPLWSAFALDAGRAAQDLDALADPELSFRFKGKGLVHDEICQDGDVQELTTQILATMMTLPARQGSIEWNGAEFLSRLLAAGLGNRGAEVEIRVAKWAREVDGSHVVFNENPDRERSHDLFIDGARVEVKLCEGDQDSIAKQIRKGISQVQHHGKVIVVVGEHATQPMAVYKEARADELLRAFPKPPVGVVVHFVEERDLPPFIGKRAP